MGAAVPASDLPSSIVPADDLPDSAAPASSPGQSVGSQVAEATLGPSELLGGTILGIPHAAAHAAVDLYRRWTGEDTNAPDPGAVQALEPTQYMPDSGAAGQQLIGDIKSTLTPQGTDVASQTQDIRNRALGPQNATVGDVLNQTGQVVQDVGALAPVVGGVIKGASALADAAAAKTPSGITSAAQAAANTAASATNASAAAIDASKLSAGTQAELATVKNVNPVALTNIHDAETLPVPMTGERGLTAGQATQDSDQISSEFNRKGEDNNAIGRRYDAQDEGLQENLGEIHRQAAPDAVGNDDIQNGQAIIDSLKRYDQPKVAAINDAYDAAKAANNGDLQMDATGFGDNVAAALKPGGKARFLPPEIQGIVDDISAAPDGRIPLDDMEGYRTALANAARKADMAGDGNASGAIAKVRDQLETIGPTDDASANARSLYDNARSLARSRFAEMDADPAYKAAVEDDTPEGRLSPLADKFTQKYVLNGAKADLQQLRPKLDQDGGQAMTSAAMNYLKNGAALSKGKFLQSGYNAALTKILPKAPELVGSSDTLDQLQQLGRVSKNMQVSSRGGYSNTSHSYVAAAKEFAGNAIEDLANGAIPGVRAGTKAIDFLRRRSGTASIHEALKPGAGLEN